MYIRTLEYSEPGIGLPPPLPKSRDEWGKPILPAPRPTFAERIRTWLADQILNDANITLATAHVSGVNDNATARKNIEDTANGSAASRSSYGNAPGGSVKLNTGLLMGLLALAETYSFSISELAGGSHTRGSPHYKGVSVDVNVINGRRVSRTHPDVANFRRDCRKLGATNVLGPGDKDHDTHIHCAWP
jgi:zinc D-Ala-D-Ala carboxypeptidase